jgi:hypothetical protein
LILDGRELEPGTIQLFGNLPLDTDNKDQLLLGWDVEGAILLGETLKTDLLTLLVTVLLDVLLGALENDTTLLLLGLLNTN